MTKKTSKKAAKKVVEKAVKKEVVPVLQGVIDRDDNGARGIFLRALAAPPIEGNFNAFVAN